MKPNKKILGRIILIISITVLVAGFYFYSSRNGSLSKTADPNTAAVQKGKT